MSKIWFSSDLHLMHNREFIYEKRGFMSTLEMSEALIRNINHSVKEDDILYLLGDLMLCDDKVGLEFLKQINCQNINIMKGNHDSSKRLKLYKELPNVVNVSVAEVIKYNKKQFYVSHYPTNVSNMNDPQPIFSLHGHTHSSDRFENMGMKAYNVAIEAHNNFPVEIEEIISDIKLYLKF